MCAEFIYCIHLTLLEHGQMKPGHKKQSDTH